LPAFLHSFCAFPLYFFPYMQQLVDPFLIA
jgi:hypothetical protein